MATFGIAFTVVTDDDTPSVTDAVGALADVMAVQAEGGLYLAGTPDAEEVNLDGQWVDNEYVCDVTVSYLVTGPGVPVATVTLAHVSTGSFDFTAVGSDESGAQAALLAGWERHLSDYPHADPELMSRALADGDVTFTEIPVGGCMRDGGVLS